MTLKQAEKMALSDTELFGERIEAHLIKRAFLD